MGRVTDSISAVNSAVRTLLATVVVGGVGAGGWYAYSFLHANESEAKRAAEALAAARSDLDRATAELERKEVLLQRKDAEITTLNDQVQKQQIEIHRLDTSLRLLKVNHRVARMTVLDQVADASTGQTSSLVQFEELDDQGKVVGEPRQFRIQGDLVYIDSWVVKFEDQYVEKAAIDRATSLVLFRRIFGEFQEPKDGFALDADGARPEIYGRGGKMSDLERQIWSDFWTVANDESRQSQLGIRAAHGDAPSIRVKKGRVYRVELRASDGLTIKPEGEVAPATPPAA
jgi:hypothetical protein